MKRDGNVSATPASAAVSSASASAVTAPRTHRFRHTPRAIPASAARVAPLQELELEGESVHCQHITITSATTYGWNMISTSTSSSIASRTSAFRRVSIATTTFSAPVSMLRRR